MSIFKREAIVLLLILLFPIIFFIISLIKIVPSYLDRQDNIINLQELYSDFDLIILSLENYKKDIGRYPTTEEGLIMLIKNIKYDKNWKGPYLHIKYLIDPWGMPYKYENNFSLFIASSGSNKKWDSNIQDIKNKKSAKDDIIKWLIIEN